MFSAKLATWTVLCLSFGTLLPAQTLCDSAWYTARPGARLSDPLNAINVKLDFNGNDEWYRVTSDDVDYDIRPNFALKNRLSFSYRFLSVGFTFLPGLYPGNNDNERRGETEDNGLSLNLNFGSWIQELEYSNVKGFYLQNSEDFIPNWVDGETPYYQFPDLKIVTYRGTTLYKFNPEFSLRALTTQTELQLRNTGSIMVGLLYSYEIIDDKSPFPNSPNTYYAGTFETLLNFGYYHTFVLGKHWYATAGASPNMGIYSTRLTTYNPNEADATDAFTKAFYRMRLDASVGYASRRFIAGINYNGFRVFERELLPSITRQSVGTAFQFFLGYRFNPPKWLRQPVQTVEELLPGK